MKIRKKIFLRAVCVAILSTSFAICQAQEVSGNWGAECVGRLKISLPGEIDIAGYGLKRLKEELNIRGQQQQFEFEDGQEAGWSSLSYGGSIYISNQLDQEQYAAFKIQIEKRIEKAQELSKNKKNKDGSSQKFQKSPVGSQIGFAWHIDEAFRAFLKVGEHVFWWIATGREISDEKSLNVMLSKILSGLSYRAPHEVPYLSGVCLPFSFIREDGVAPLYRSIAMTYRLKAHPDITVMLQDATAEKYDSDRREKSAKPDNVIDDFWTQYRGFDTTIGSMWDFPIKRSVTLAGQKGLASFVKINRKDNVDYGYFATVRGNPKAKTDTPDLRLYVIQESSNAKAKGIAPMGKDEFLKMAQTIAASVQRRPTQ